MKVEFYFAKDPIGGGYSKEKYLANESIEKKVHNKVIDLICIPTKEMYINIYSFSDVYGFTKNEMGWLEDEQSFRVTEIFVHVDRFEVWLELQN